MDHRRFHVITGASGSGKSTLVAALSDLGYGAIPEAALAIMKEQLLSNGEILPSIDRTAFMEAVIARSIQDHERAHALEGPVFFDRGLPEWLRFIGANTELALAAAGRRYAGTIFVTEPWSEVYVCDEYRRHDFERAARSYEPTISAYVEAGYRTCVVPKVGVGERVRFILGRVEAFSAE